MLRKRLAVFAASLTFIMRRGLLAPPTLLALAAFGGCAVTASQDAQYEALEEQAAFAAKYGGGSGICDLVQESIEAGGMVPPLAYSMDVLERYTDEHC